ncbi:MAG: hypothetical protein RLZZ301_743 [Bacteroidota bacterium]|jgi:NAD(P)-dependent dehydrogenase (short-subunit alcohol dehydrogenase family)
MSTFRGKVAIVTGSSRGIGKGIALALAQKGANVVINGRNLERLQACAQEIEAHGVRCLIVQADVSQETQAQQLITDCLAHFGRLDILINNVGVSARGRIEDLHADVYKQVFESNVFGSLFPTKAALPFIRQQKGSIVFISSLAAIHGLPALGPYSASKMALQAFTDTIRLEEKSNGVHCGILHVAMTEIVHDKQVLDAAGKLIQLKARKAADVMTIPAVAHACLQLIQKRKARVTLSFMGKLNLFLNRVSPKFVEWILLKNLDKFKEQSQ